MSRVIKVGELLLGGDNDVVIQSMTNVKTSDYDALLAQIQALELVGCKIIRLAVTSSKDVEVSKRIIERIKTPLAADIQFDYRLAVASSEAGFAKVRINPGNIGSVKELSEVVAACKANKTVIRVGTNSGSIQAGYLAKAGSLPKAIAYSAAENVLALEKLGFNDIIVSAKASSVSDMVEANRILAKLLDYPLHLGVTESGSREMGMIKSAVGIGALLLDGIGATIRVSLSCDPCHEVRAARQILRSVGIDKNYCEVISCPTCARCNYNLEGIVEWLEDYTKDLLLPLKIAVMGCAVNGPGEAKEADFGIAGGKEDAVLFEKGVVIKRVPFENIASEITSYINKRISAR